MIWLLLLVLLLRPLRGCLKSILLVMLMVWLVEHRPDILRDIGKLINRAEQELAQFLSEQTNTSPTT